jgi:hypothetical protein
MKADITRPEPDREQVNIFFRTLFKHAASGTFVSLRSFYDDDSTKPFAIETIPVDDREEVVDAAYHQARRAANDKRKIVFCPPVATFTNTQHAGKADVADGLTLTAECDEKLQAARALLEKLLGPATLVVASGGEWTNPETGEIEPKLHLHWRLKKPARGDDRVRLEEARELVIEIAGSDPTHGPISHPIRWPGSIHRKGEPKLCRIIAENPKREIDLATALAALKKVAPPVVSHHTTNGSAQGAASDWGELIAGILSAESYHEPLIRLAAKLLATGMSDGAAVNLLEGLMDSSTGPHDDRWQARRADITRGVSTAREKYGHQEAPLIIATPHVWVDPSKIPQRQWLYKPHYIRKFLSATFSTGGVGKSSLIIAEALAMVTDKLLLDVCPSSALGVWYWNGEDPGEELDRRFAAAEKHHNLKPEDIGGRLFVDSGRTMPIVIAEDDRTGTRVATPVINEVITTLLANKIDVLIIDPFVACHRVAENNNSGIERVAKSWSHIAEAANCSIMLVHHVRKTGGESVTVEDGRGASALLAAARTARTLNTMTIREAENAEIPENERRLHFRADIGKANLTRPAERADWFKLVSVDLQNNEIGSGGDEVGVVTSWTYPEVNAPTITTADIRRAQEAIKAGGPWREDQRSTKETWVGIPVAQALNLNAERKSDKRAIVDVIRDWLRAGWLKKVGGQDAGRKAHTYVEAGKAPVDMEAAPVQGPARPGKAQND